MPESAKRAFPEADHLVGDKAVLAVVDQRDRHALHAAIFAGGTDRECKLAQAALEQHRVRSERDDTDGQRRREHGRVFKGSAAATNGARRLVRDVSGRIVEE